MDTHERAQMNRSNSRFIKARLVLAGFGLYDSLDLVHKTWSNGGMSCR